MKHPTNILLVAGLIGDLADANLSLLDALVKAYELDLEREDCLNFDHLKLAQEEIERFLGGHALMLRPADERKTPDEQMAEQLERQFANRQARERRHLLDQSRRYLGKVGTVDLLDDAAADESKFAVGSETGPYTRFGVDNDEHGCTYRFDVFTADLPIDYDSLTYYPETTEAAFWGPRGGNLATLQAFNVEKDPSAITEVTTAEALRSDESQDKLPNYFDTDAGPLTYGQITEIVEAAGLIASKLSSKENHVRITSPDSVQLLWRLARVPAGRGFVVEWYNQDKIMPHAETVAA